MSDKEYVFSDTNPENQKPHNISGKNPRSVQTLHKNLVKPKSQDKDVEFENVENEDNTYKPKTSYLVQKDKMQLKRRVAPGVSEIIIRKNEEKRKLAEEQAKQEAAEKEAEQKAQEEAEAEVQKEAEPEAEEEVEEVKVVVEKVKEVKVSIGKTDENAEAESVEDTAEETAEEQASASSGLSFTQALREQGLIEGKKILDAVEKATPEIKSTIKEAKAVVDEVIEDVKASANTDGKSFTQALREQGLIEGKKILDAVEKATPEIKSTIKEAKAVVDEVIEEAKAKVDVESAEEVKEEPAGDGLSFTQSLRQEGFIQTDAAAAAPQPEIKEEVKEEPKAEVVTESKEEPAGDGLSFTQSLRQQGLIVTDAQATPQPETKEEAKEEVKEEAKEEVKEEAKEEVKEEAKEEPKADTSSDGEVKTFIDLIRSEGLL